MRTISELVCGVRGAEQGFADILSRDGGNTATWWVDFEGDVQNTTGASIPLDANGGAIVYVNQAVRVRVKDSNGVVLREFVSSDAAPGVEVVSTAFTGADYENGAINVSEPTTLQAIADLWKTNSGGLNWKVGTHPPTSETRPLSALAPMFHRFFVVTDPAYGAKGDGTSDDTAAINAAVAAAVAAGGGTVYFPAGTYRVTATITPIGPGVSIVGVVNQSSIVMDHSSNAVLNFTATTASVYQHLRGLGISAGQAHTGALITQAASNGLLIEDCVVGHATFNNGQLITHSGASCRTRIRDTFLQLGSSPTAATQWISGNTSSGEVHIEYCRVSAPTGSWSPTVAGITAAKVIAENTLFYLAILTGGVATAIAVPGNGQVVLSGNDFTADGSGTVAAFTTSSALTAAARIFDLGNIFNCTSGMVLADPGVLQAEQVMLASRDASVFYSDVTTGAFVTTPPATDKVRAYVMKITNATPFAFGLGPVYEGQELTLMWLNNSGGGTGALTISAAAVYEGSTTLTIGQKMTADFIAVRDTMTSDTLKWFQVGTRLKV